MTTQSLWRCPQCGRQFRTKNQWHSCIRYTVDSHFEGKPPELRATFDSLIVRLRRIGSIRVVAVKSSIQIAGGAVFAVAYVLKNSLNLEFALDRELRDQRVFRAQPIGGRLVSHFVKLRRKDDVDAQLLGWLKEAYALKR